MSNCKCGCYKDTICACTETILLNVALEINTQYKVVVTDKFGRKYKYIATSTADGTIEMPVSEFPEGLFTEHSGNFRLQIYPYYVDEADNQCNPLAFKMASMYDCIEFSVFGGDSGKRNLGCEFITYCAESQE